MPGASPVAVISHGLWLRLFGGSRDVTRRTIEISGHPYSIIGVAPAGFQGLNQLTGADVFLPLSAYPRVYPSPGMVAQRRALLFSEVGRLKPGVSLRQAESAMQSLAQELERQYPRDNQGRRVSLTTVAEAALNARTRPGGIASRRRADDDFRPGAADRVRQCGQPAVGAGHRAP